MFTLNTDRIYFFDGAMGTMLQSRGLKLREVPETLNITNPELIRSVHAEYSQAGADFITANTFGANRFKLSKSGFTVQEVIQAGLKIAHESADSHSLVALDIGPTGRVIAPLGDASFTEVYDAVAEMVNAGKSQSDVILLETFTLLFLLHEKIPTFLSSQQ